LGIRTAREADIPVCADAPDAAPTSLFIFQLILFNRLKANNLQLYQPLEEPHEYLVEPVMKTKHLFGLVTAVALTGFAASAQAGWSLNFAFGLPVPFPAAVVVAGPRCAPPVVYCPPPSPYYLPPVVYVPAPYRPVVYVAPRCAPGYGYRDHRGPAHGQRGGGDNDRGHNHGGRR